MIKGRKALRIAAFILLGIALVAVALLLLLPAPITGCYTFSDATTAGHNFLHFGDGKVTWVLEYNKSRSLGTYEYVEGEGWIWIDCWTGRRILVRPGVFTIRFEPADGIDRVPKFPIEDRDWNFRKTAELIRRASTNTITKP